MYKHLVYPHLVVDESKWCIPTWLGDWCMYESLVIGRPYSLSWVVESCYSFEKYFCRLCMCLGGAWTDWYILTCTKGELNQRFQHVLMGSMDSVMNTKWREYLNPHIALNVKGREWFGVVVAIKSKGGDCWHYYIGVVLDGNSLRGQMTVQQVNNKYLMIRERYMQVNLDKGVYTRGLTNQKVRIMYTRSFTEGKVRTCWKTKFWSVVFRPWYFDPWYWSKVSGSKYWSQVFGPRYWS